jgi:hypothetical protein
MKPHFRNFSKIDFILVIALITIAVSMYVIFNFSVFVTSDEVRYAIGFKQLALNYSQPFNYEMSFGYYQTLSLIISLIPQKEIAAFLNTIASTAGTLVLIPLYFLSKALLNSRVAFFTGLFLIFSPSYWLLSRYGHPSMLSILFFLSSMAYFYKALYIKNKGKPGVFLGLAIIFAILAMSMRADVILWFTTPIGLAIYGTKISTKRAYSYTLIFIIACTCLYIISKVFLLGYLINPSGGTVLFHLQNRLPSITIAMKSIIKNSALFSFSLLPLCLVCLFISLVHLAHTKQWRMLALISMWGCPMLIFMPFLGMDFPRLSVMSLPPALLSISLWIDNLAKNGRLKTLIPIALLITSHISLLMLGQEISRLYSFKVSYKDKAISSVPLSLIFTDYYLRKEYLEKLNSDAHTVVNQTERDIVIVTSDSYYPWYMFDLFYERNLTNISLIGEDDDIAFLFAQTSKNRFYFYIVKNWQIQPQKLVSFLNLEETQNAKVHFNLFLFKPASTRLFFEPNEVNQLFGDLVP